MKKTKLELTWPGKDEQPALEPRILIEHPDRAHHAAMRCHGDLFDNLLIKGDNLLALKALEAEYAGRIKCIYIDPPYNINAATPFYDDGLEHSLWLSLMHQRLVLLRHLLATDGLIVVQIDDQEMPYLCVMMDEIFGRANRVNIVAVKMSEASGVKMSHTERRLPKLKEYLLIYRNQTTPQLTIDLVPIGAWNDEYKTLMVGVERDALEELKGIISADIRSQDGVNRCNEILKGATTESLSSYFQRAGISDKKEQERFKFDNAWRIIQAVGSSSVLALAKAQPQLRQEIAAALSARGLIYLYKTDFDPSAKQPRIQVIFADENLMRNPGDFWTDIKTTGGVGQEGGSVFPNGKKPEALIKRVIAMCTRPGDLVLDSFAGSGTTGAVAHKMRRRWILIEKGNHADTHIVPRLTKVIDGEDAGGVTKAVDWEGGGGFRYFTLAPSLLERDHWGNWVIAREYNAAMLAEAMCKHLGFTYAPAQDEAEYWRHGQSSETDFLYVTTQSLTHDALKLLSDEVGPGRTLMICARAFSGSVDAFPNLTCRKIPSTILTKCEWGRDDYSLNVAALSTAANDPPDSGPLFAAAGEHVDG
ncbi:site-specific DNA-methyltransferase [Sphingomonas melonis]|uniref:site-specific DNA-methyltransferase (adenine-specific) n=1 Tax=Sphingomonas melonis TaxID=152682 RepID=A0A7Y9K439_9SPHN|nr:adenine-specific DNA-methyltransferase [Sphingomonas melonis]